jgi:hypothetical protein
VAGSRLYSPEASKPTVGMFVPGLAAGAATLRAVLPSMSHSADPAKGFRTNLGVVNSSDAGQTISIWLYDAVGTLLGQRSVSLDAGEAIQINDVFGHFGVLVDVPAAYALVRGDGLHPFFAYAAVVDNRSQDPIFVTGQSDPEPPATAAADSVR